MSNRLLILIIYKIKKNAYQENLNRIETVSLLFIYVFLEIMSVPWAIVLDNIQLHYRDITVPDNILQNKIRQEADMVTGHSAASFQLQIS